MEEQRVLIWLCFVFVSIAPLLCFCSAFVFPVFPVFYFYFILLKLQGPRLLFLMCQLTFLGYTKLTLSIGLKLETNSFHSLLLPPSPVFRPVQFASATSLHWA